MKIVQKKGFTLVEMVLAIAIVGVMSGFLGPIIVNSIQNYGIILDRKGALNDARLAMERMVREVRLLSGTASIDTANATTFQFDLASENNIQYTRDGVANTITRNSAAQVGAAPIANNASALSFTYYDTAGSATTTIANIWRIEIDLTITAGNSGSIRLRSQVFPRQFSTDYAGFQ